MIIDIEQLSVIERQQWLQHAIGPRPICFASTMDAAGKVNLSPFSFFNLFSTNPPIIVFSPSRRARDNTTKHTLQNLLEVPEVVVNICDYNMVQQVSLSSCEFPKGVDEFIKAGFTKEPATVVKPPMVKESKVKLECKIKKIKSLGKSNDAGNLVLAEVLKMHVDESILNKDGNMIDQQKLHLIARLGGDWYAVVNENNLFKVPKPNIQLGIGFDALPDYLKKSVVLTGNDLGKLANVNVYPVVDASFIDKNLDEILKERDTSTLHKKLQLYAKELLDRDEVNHAWQVLLKIHF